MFPFNYYFETNSIYHISRIPKDGVLNGFTSALAIWELIAGINSENYRRRKGICQNITDSGITIDWRLPEEIIFESFGISEDYEFVDRRSDLLAEAFSTVVNVSDFDEFAKLKTTTNWGYFESSESRWRDQYIKATLNGIKNLHQSFKDRPNEEVIFNGKTYSLRTIKEVQMFLTQEFTMNRAITINSFVQLFLNSPVIANSGITEQDVFESYTGLIDNFISVYSKKVTSMIAHQAPQKNDFVDLLHLLYLRNLDTCKIVSDDKLFGICEELRLKIKTIIH